LQALLYCPHWTDVRLDRGSDATTRDGEFVCEKHGATFRTTDGECTHGPCEGATLDAVDVTVADGGVYPPTTASSSTRSGRRTTSTYRRARGSTSPGTDTHGRTSVKNFAGTSPRNI